MKVSVSSSSKFNIAIWFHQSNMDQTSWCSKIKIFELHLAHHSFSTHQSILLFSVQLQTAFSRQFYDKISMLVLIHRTMKNIVQNIHIRYNAHHKHHQIVSFIFSKFFDIKLCFFYFINWNWVCSFHSISFKFNIVSNISIFILFHDFSRELSFSLNYSIKSSCANHKISQNNIFFFNSFLCVFHSIVVSRSTIFTMFNDFFSTWSYSHFYFKIETKNSKGSSSMLNIIIKHSSSLYSLIYSFVHRSYCSISLYQIFLILYCLTLSFLTNRLMNHSSFVLYRNGSVSLKCAGLWIHFSFTSSVRNSWYNSSSFL